MLLQVFVLYQVVVQTVAIYTTPPVWVTSHYVRAGNENVIAVLTNQTTSPIPNHNFTFSSPLTGTPNLGYGIKAYEGYDYLGEEQFQVNRTYLDRFQFRVTVQIIGVTNILRLNVPYIAIDPTFPHHLNSFDNVPVNYSAGPISNISVSSSSLQTYTNTINYTTQSSLNHYKTFLSPYTRNKVLLFMTSLKFQGTTQKNNPPPYRPIDLHVSTEVISVDQYKIVVTLSKLVNITKLHFSMVIFDQTDVESTGLYMLVYQVVEMMYTGGFVSVPVEFVNNFIMGFIYFSANRTGSILDFQWDFGTVNGVHGAVMPRSVGQTNKAYGVQTINKVAYTLFYLKTWICPNQTYFDPAQNLCTGCPIINCINCYNLTVCALCDQPNDFFLNTTSSQCIPCSLQGCLNCTNLTSCQTCNTTSGYSLTNQTCLKCTTLPNTFLNTTTEQCEVCNISHCVVCYNLTQCLLCDQNSSYYVGVVGGQCAYCDRLGNFFIVGGNCVACGVVGCQVCGSVSTCVNCSAADGYYLNGTICQYDCSIINNCSLPTPNNTNTTTNTTDNNSTNNSTQNTTYPNNTYINSTSNDSTLDNATFDNTTLDNTTFNNSTFDNSTTDNTTINNGTNNNSTINNGTNNNTAVNNGTFNGSVDWGNGDFDGYVIIDGGQNSDFIYKRTGCNQFTVQFPTLSISPTCLSLAYSPTLPLTPTSTSTSPPSLHLTYHSQIPPKPFPLLLPCPSPQPALLLLLNYTSMLPALHYSQAECAVMENIGHLLTAVEIVSYILLVMSVLSCKIVGLELFGVLQLTYFVLVDYDYFNIYLYPLTQFKTFNGLNIPFLTQPQPPQSLHQLHLSTNFLNNCNIMLLLLFAQLLISTLLYLLSQLSKSQKLQKFSIKLLKQGLTTLVMFNVFNVAFSAGIHLKYVGVGDQGYWVGVGGGVMAGLVVFGASFGLELCEEDGYGEFKAKFKNNFVCRLYIFLSTVYRFAIGMYLALNHQSPQSTLLILSISLTFIMYNLINLPFQNPLQNYRCNLIHLTQLLTLFSANYYRSMKMNTPLEIKARIYAPAILELILIVFCIGMSALVLVYEIVGEVRHWAKRRKVGEMDGDGRNLQNQSNQTIATF